MKLRKNCKNWEIDFTKLGIFGLVFLLLIGSGIAVTTIYDTGSTATAIASNMTVAGTLNVSNYINSTGTVYGAHLVSLGNVNATQATIATLTGTTFKDGTATLTGGVLSGLTTLNVTTSNATRSEALTFNGTVANITGATIGTLVNTQLNGTQATIATLTGTTFTDGTATLTAGDLTGVDDVNATDVNITGSLVVGMTRPAAIPGAIYLNFTDGWGCLMVYNGSNWGCSNGTWYAG